MGLWPLVEWGADRFSSVAHMGGLQHISHYHRHRLRRLLEGEGFEIEAMRTFSTFAPFAAILSQRAASLLDSAERRLDLPFGNLLAVLAKNQRPIETRAGATLAAPGTSTEVR